MLTSMKMEQRARLDSEKLLIVVFDINTVKNMGFDFCSFTNISLDLGMI